MYNAWHHFSVNCCFMHFFLKLKEKYACNYIETIHFLFRWSMLQIGFHGIHKKKKWRTKWLPSFVKTGNFNYLIIKTSNIVSIINVSTCTLCVCLK